MARLYIIDLYHSFSEMVLLTGLIPEGYTQARAIAKSLNNTCEEIFLQLAEQLRWKSSANYARI